MTYNFTHYNLPKLTTKSKYIVGDDKNTSSPLYEKTPIVYKKIEKNGIFICHFNSTEYKPSDNESSYIFNETYMNTIKTKIIVFFLNNYYNKYSQLVNVLLNIITSKNSVITNKDINNPTKNNRTVNNLPLQNINNNTKELIKIIVNNILQIINNPNQYWTNDYKKFNPFNKTQLFLSEYSNTRFHYYFF